MNSGRSGVKEIFNSMDYGLRRPDKGDLEGFPSEPARIAISEESEKAVDSW